MPHQPTQRQEINLDFTTATELTEYTLLGQPCLQYDDLAAKQGLYCNGKSALSLLHSNIDAQDFKLCVDFRSTATHYDGGVLGSYGYCRALRLEKATSNLTFWADFPSPTAPQRVTFAVADLLAEHQVMIQRAQGTYTVCVDGDIQQLTYAPAFPNAPLFLGCYYAIRYGFIGYIYNFSLDIGTSGA